MNLQYDWPELWSCWFFGFIDVGLILLFTFLCGIWLQIKWWCFINVKHWLLSNLRNIFCHYYNQMRKYLVFALFWLTLTQEIIKDIANCNKNQISIRWTNFWRRNNQNVFNHGGGCNHTIKITTKMVSVIKINCVQAVSL